MSGPVKRASGVFVNVLNNNVDWALRRLRRSMIQEGVFKDVRKRQHFIAPGDKRRLQKQEEEKRYFRKLIKGRIRYITWRQSQEK